MIVFWIGGAALAFLAGWRIVGGGRAGLIGGAGFAALPMLVFAAQGLDVHPGQPLAPRLAVLHGQALDVLLPEQELAVLADRVRQSPDDVDARRAWGQALFRFGELEQAYVVFGSVAQRRPEAEDFVYLAEIARLLNGGAMTAGANAAVEAALDLEPENPRALWLLAQARLGGCEDLDQRSLGGAPDADAVGQAACDTVGAAEAYLSVLDASRAEPSALFLYAYDAALRLGAVPPPYLSGELSDDMRSQLDDAMAAVRSRLEANPTDLMLWLRLARYAQLVSGPVDAERHIDEAMGVLDAAPNALLVLQAAPLAWALEAQGHGFANSAFAVQNEVLRMQENEPS